jgi:hypothetical protein
LKRIKSGFDEVSVTDLNYLVTNRKIPINENAFYFNWLGSEYILSLAFKSSFLAVDHP